jgi:CheY-like chemotaxis protein
MFFQLSREVLHMGPPPLHASRNRERAIDNPKLILSVDDEAGILYTRQKILEAAGYDVLSAADGEQALGFFAAILVDLVLLDFAMPGIDGGRVAQQMKAIRPLVPVILVTGLPIEKQSVPCVDWIYVKGDNPVLLLEKIDRLLSPPSPARRARKFDGTTDSRDIGDIPSANND